MNSVPDDRTLKPIPTEADAKAMPTTVKGASSGAGCSLRVRQKGPIHYAGLWKPTALGGGGNARLEELCWCYGGPTVGWEEIHEYSWKFTSEVPTGLRLCQDMSIQHRLYDAGGNLCDTIIDYAFETWPASQNGRETDTFARTFRRSLTCGDMVGCTVESSAFIWAYFARLLDREGKVLDSSGFEILYQSEARVPRQSTAPQSHDVSTDQVSELKVEPHGNCDIRWTFEYKVSHCEQGTGWRIDNHTRGPKALAAFWSRGPGGRALTSRMLPHPQFTGQHSVAVSRDAESEARRTNWDGLGWGA